MAGKKQTNFIIDALMLLAGSLLAGTGFLMKWVLIPGKDRFATFGRNVDLFFLGLDRHEWGALHLWLAFALLLLLAMHIALHAGWLVSMARSMMAGRRGHIIAAVFLLLCLVFALFAFAVQPEVRDSSGGKGHDLGKGRMEHRLRN